MIVVDNDVISYFWLNSGRTDAARKARSRDGDWHSPRLWRSEFRNVLYQHMAHRDLYVTDAIRIIEMAESDMYAATYSVDSGDVLRLSSESEHPAYDCEYVALARELDVLLVTGDRKLPDLFPETAVLLEDFAAGEGKSTA